MAGGSITGLVLNQQDGQPLDGADCALQTGARTQTDNQGNFAFDGQPSGYDYELVVSKNGFQDGVYGPLVIIDDSPTHLVVALQPTDI